MATHTTKMLIIGSGPAGYSAAIYAARAMLAPIVVQGLQPGGQLTITTDVENYPGFRDVVQGPWLMEEMRAQAEHVGTRMIWDTIVTVDLANGSPFRAIGDSGDEYIADCLVICTGAQAKWLGVPGEMELGGKGVSACATCDGFFYRGKKVAVIGGGNTAVEEALYLTNHSDNVTLIHRRDSLRAEKILQERVFANPKISVLWNKAVDSFEAGAGGMLQHLALTDTVTGEASTLAVDGAFVAIGHAPFALVPTIGGPLSLLAMAHAVALPTMHLQLADPACDLDYVPNTARPGAAGRTMLSNSFAFGGTNAVLALRAAPIA
jgi:thioredoxin reductase (NADPH)